MVLLNELFSLNPTLFFEVARIEARVTNCVLPQQVFLVDVDKLNNLANLVSSYMNGLVDVEKLIHKINEIEFNVGEELKTNNLRKKLNELDMEVLPFCTLIDRILSSKEILVFPTVQYYVYDSSKERQIRKKLRRIRKLEMMILEKQDKLKNRMKIIKREGELLGYPKCCINEFLKLKRKAVLFGSITPEKKVVMELLDLEILKTLPEIFNGLSFDLFYSLFSLNFYPCTIKCKRAVKIGKTCVDYLDQFGYRKAYECCLLFNAFYHLVTGYKSYLLLKDGKCKSKYSKKVVTHFSKLRPDIEEVLSAAKNVITDVKFGNEFIKNCVKVNL